MNTKLLTKIEEKQIKKVPEIRPGDTVRVHQKIKEGNKERIQIFEGVVIRLKGGGIRQSFLVRKISFGVGVEKNFLIQSPNIAKIEVKKRAKVRQAYLGYLRNLTGKSARLKDKQFDSLTVNIEDNPSADAQDVPEKIEEAPVPASTEELAQAEEAIAEKEDKAGSETAEESEQVAEEVEIEHGVEEAETDVESKQASEGELAEKHKEEIEPEKTEE